MVDYDQFLEKLKKSEAAPLMKHFKEFLQRFNSEERSLIARRKLIASFLNFIYSETLMNSLFAEITEDEDLENVREGWEKLVMINVYTKVFNSPDTEDSKMDTHLGRNIRQYSWIEERHLDLPFDFQHTLEVAQAELLRINGFKSPRDKLITLQNTMQLLVDIIKKVSGNTAGSDHLLPSLILTMVRANPPHIIANIKYVMRFRNQQVVEEGANQYCLTNFMSAISFMYNITIDNLTIPDEEKPGRQTFIKDIASYFTGTGTNSGGSSPTRGKNNAGGSASGSTPPPSLSLSGSANNLSAIDDTHKAPAASASKVESKQTVPTTSVGPQADIKQKGVTFQHDTKGFANTLPNEKNDDGRNVGPRSSSLPTGQFLDQSSPKKNQNAPQMPDRSSPYFKDPNNPDSGSLTRAVNSAGGWFNNMIKEVRTIGEEAGKKVDDFMTSVILGSDDEEDDEDYRGSYLPSNGGPPLPPRKDGKPRSPERTASTSPHKGGQNLKPVSKSMAKQLTKEEEDYQLQLALAISLSMKEEEESQKRIEKAKTPQDLIDFDSVGGSSSQAEAVKVSGGSGSGSGSNEADDTARAINDSLEEAAIRESLLEDAIRTGGNKVLLEKDAGSGSGSGSAPVLPPKDETLVEAETEADASKTEEPKEEVVEEEAVKSDEKEEPETTGEVAEKKDDEVVEAEEPVEENLDESKGETTTEAIPDQKPAAKGKGKGKGKGKNNH